jgi:hypothetical protein
MTGWDTPGLATPLTDSQMKWLPKPCCACGYNIDSLSGLKLWDASLLFSLKSTGHVHLLLITANAHRPLLDAVLSILCILGLTPSVTL